ncbi:choice-of-anchor I family protein [Shewanella zhangzhouensis]|uniref:choice-of-anchor I family protein n=1 Tax=Shewanella zhangzhouensis TaxID=2864213 RepID=UPI001C65B4C8|nr:choice-of-anchor I family protein [Shewanella zhangzhouensis]QYK04856.1 collagen-like protein [Shewanella zhangzhouensis]
MTLRYSLLALALASLLAGCSTDGDDGAKGEPGAPGISGPEGQPGQDAVRELDIQVVGRFASGIYGKSAAEIVQFHKASAKVFAINAASNHIEVISLAGLPTAAVANPVSDNSLTSTPMSFPASVKVKNADDSETELTLGVANSLAIQGDWLALAVENAVKTATGAVLFYQLDSNGSATFVKAVAAGALPDMLTFTPDGTRVLVANEGEPDTDYLADPEGSISVIALGDNQPADMAQHINFGTDMRFSSKLIKATDYDTDAKRMALLKASGVKFAGPDGTTAAQDIEPEYISVAADSKTAWVSLQENNAIGIVDLEAMTVEVKALGVKDWSQYRLDFTNKDEVIQLQHAPGVYGMYQPDTIATYSWNGATFIVSANEGDSRDWNAYSEDIRVADVVDPDEFNLQLSAELQNLYDVSGGKNGLGRLKVTSALLDEDQDGIVERLYAYGGRSFSIWDAQLNQVFDSGDDFGRIAAAVLGNNANSSHSENKGDDRSDDKGGEPEAIDVGTINGRTYAFIGQERSGDLFVYDISNPFQAAFVAHYNNRNFDVSFELDDELANPCDSSEGMDCTEVPNAGDLGPESIKFISADDSPSGQPLLVVGNEVSGSVTLYQVSEK